ncbi:MAG: patatin-like phospholipase family protein, partial [Actinobacteria bacterium]|nr:patatin-like phospholipase family protein [Actinomycetota bacterium]NIU18996.1 patatin-like phospholipase family protein [Actinomycetota bacterium]NIU66018.1 patatin-like phospholipase family protein [Actinomycetota bacterium]NIV86875.1 patatin-like phospholipase family protein [Actinomycetota bacterium]NIW27822.1 patatin-like phospholipase family protein [Actinomycetota bacterium]
MFSIGLVLSAGGMLGDPFHAGVLARLAATTGWDARRA